MSAVSYDICNSNLIYNSEFNYSLPKSILESYLSGKAFDNPEFYTQDESKRLHEDIHDIFQTILSANPIKENLAIMTAGGPGAGKTTLMRQDIEKQSLLGRNIAYICPDDICLKSQTRTYKTDIAHEDGSKEMRLALYNKWRPGSNAATHLILANLIRERYAFYYGTTSTAPTTNKFLDFLKKQGYHIRLLHVTAPDTVCWESIVERDKTFVQTTEKDVCEKGLLFPQRIMDTYLAYADTIEFYYRDAVKQDARLAAIWTRNNAVKVLSPEDYEQIKAIHNAAIETLNRPELRWELTVEGPQHAL